MNDQEPIHFKRYVPPVRTERQIGANLSNVREASATSDAIFVHSILPYVIPFTTSVLRPGTSWQAKASLAMLGPNLSGSFIIPGNDEKYMVGRFGFVIAGGKITGAFTGDRGTIARSSGEREARFAESDDPEKQFLETLRFRKEQTDISDIMKAYNEVNISRPVIGPLYICQDQPVQSADGILRRSDHIPTQEEKDRITIWGTGIIYDIPPEEEIYAFAEQYGLPVVIIKNGRAYASRYEGKYIPDSQLSIEQVLEMRKRVTKEQALGIVKYLEAEQPFRFDKINTPENKSAKDYLEGMDAFIGLNAYLHPEQFGNTFTPFIAPGGKPFRTTKEDLNFGLEIGHITSFSKKEVVELGSAYRDGLLVKYYLRRMEGYDGGYSFKVFKTTERSECFTVDDFRDIRKSQTALRIGNFIFSNHPTFYTINDYIQYIGQLVEVTNKDPEKYKNVRNTLLYHLYGFYREASNQGSEEESQEADSILKRSSSYEEILDLTSKRLDDRNRFVMTADDYLKIYVEQ